MVKKKRVVVRKKPHPNVMTNKKCPNCSNIVHETSKFCHHCGAHLIPQKSMRQHKCPSCKGILEEFSRYCKHCGANVDTFHHSRFVKALLYFIVFLVLALALLVFFSPTLVNVNQGYKETQAMNVASGKQQAFLKIDNAICNWEDNSFNLCTTVNWKGNTGDYVQCSFTGNLEDKKRYVSPVTCCNKVGTDEGAKLTRAFLFDSNGNSYKDDTLSATCLGKPVKQAPSAVKPLVSSMYQKSFWFNAKPKNTPTKGNGVVYIDIPGKVKSCEITGNWITKSNTGGQEQYCNGGEGLFYGSADLFDQSVFSDPSVFIWAGSEKHYFDPKGKLHEDYSVYLDLCDGQYTIEPRHYTRAVLSGFETNKLALEWDYFSSYPRPDVDVFVNLDCKLI